ncbi:MAG TPA: ABC transporter permease [Bryobacteraceae bacterium]|nr:ABC transporter permease [Bryobacteraceae bacterium]
MLFYHLLLRLFPASFRAEYGGEMAALFARRQRDCSGPFAAAGMWLAVVFETMIDAAGAHWDILRQDLRYAARTLARTPGFTITAIVVVALGIGANTAAFSVTDFVLIRPLPFPQPDKLVRVYEKIPGYKMELSPGNFRDWKNRSSSFESFGMYYTSAVNWIGNGDPQRLHSVAVDSDVLPTLSVKPILGRWFTPTDEKGNVADTVLISYRVWQSRFGADQSIIGRVMNLDGHSTQIIGVMPLDFRFPSNYVDLWLPLIFAEDTYADRANNFVVGVGRLKNGVSLQRANSELDSIAAQLEREFPRANERTRAFVIRLSDDFSRSTALLLKALCGAAFCVLLIACANLANLLLSRAVTRRKELAVRAAMGAGRERLVRQLITESLMLAVAGGVIGVFLAGVGVPLMASLVPSQLPITDRPAVDLRVLLFASGLTLLTGFAFGAWPAWRMGRGVDIDGLREGARSGGGRRERLRFALVVTEVMASVVLLVSAGLLLRALLRVQSVDPGFRAENVLTMETALPPKYEQAAQRRGFYTQVLSGVRRLPGVVNAAYITYLPMGSMRGGIFPVEIGASSITRSANNTASMRYVTPGFFDTLRIPLEQGRDVSESDTSTSASVAVVSRSFVRRYWPEGNPIGRQFKFAMHDRTVVGVVRDVRVRGLERDSEPQVYLSYQQQDPYIPFYAPKDLAIRTVGAPEAITPAVRAAIRAADAEQPIIDVKTMERVVEEDIETRSVQARLLTAFAALAFLLAAVGIHGLLAFAVSQRTREIGVRMAMGARPTRILAMVMRQAALVALAGVALGTFFAYQAALAMQSILAGVRPDDAVTFGAAAGLCAAMTIFGSWIPAWRAVRVDPIIALRSE